MAPTTPTPTPTPRGRGPRGPGAGGPSAGPASGPGGGGGGVAASTRSPFLSPRMMPILMTDYLFVIALYGSLAFWLAVLIDGHILPPFNAEAEKRKPTWLLYAQVLVQIAVQGFLAILLHTLLQYVPSPVQGVAGYDAHSPVGGVIRNPAIISVLLFALSKSMQARLMILFARFDANARA